jgi:hypothetical protein
VPSYCAQLAQAECPSVITVCTSSVTEAQCESAVEAQCSKEATTYEAAKRTFTPNNVAACVQATQQAFSGLSLSSPILQWSTLNGSNGTGNPASGSPLDVCQKVFLGTVAVDQPCTSTYDCAGSNICGENGTCGAETDQVAGGGCGNAGDLCTAGTVCTQTGSRDYTCVAGGKVGDSCSDSKPCTTAAKCSSSKCVSLGEKGSSCKSSADCDPTGSAPFCDPGLGTCYGGYDFANPTECKAFLSTTSQPTVSSSSSASKSSSKSSSSGSKASSSSS